MTRDGLDTVCRLRRQAVDAASQQLAMCIESEATATAAVRRQAAEIDRQRKAVEQADASDRDVEIFGEWLRSASARLQALSADWDRANIGTARARAELTAARTALEAVEIIQREAELAAAESVVRRERTEIDDMLARNTDGRRTQ